MTREYIDILRNVRDNHSNGTYQKALDAAIEAVEEVERLRAELDAAVKCVEAIRQARKFHRPAHVVDDALPEWSLRKEED